MFRFKSELVLKVFCCCCFVSHGMSLTITACINLSANKVIILCYDKKLDCSEILGFTMFFPLGVLILNKKALEVSNLLGLHHNFIYSHTSFFSRWQNNSICVRTLEKKLFCIFSECYSFKHLRTKLIFKKNDLTYKSEEKKLGSY